VPSVEQIAQRRDQEGSRTASRVHDGKCFQPRNESVEGFLFRQLVGGPATFPLNLIEPGTKRFIDDALDDPFWSVIDAIALALAFLVDGRPSIDLRFTDFEFGNRLLEDAA
jgi:hypothetical protein